MKFSCDQCHAQYMIADEKVGPRGVKVKCKKCSNIIVVKPTVQSDKTVVMSMPLGDLSLGTAAPAAAHGNAFGGAFGAPPGGGAAPGEGLGADVVGGGFGSSAAGSFGASGASLGASSTAGFSSTAGTATVLAPGNGGAFGATPAAGAGAGFGAGVGATFGSTTVEAGGATGGMGADAGELNLNALSGASATAALPRRPAGEKEWYVAIDDSQVGPIDISEIEARWDGRELDEDSLAWKGGMADWMPIAEIPELAYLVTQRPHAKSHARPAAAGTGAAAAASVAASLGPVAFGGGGGGEDIGWKPSAASALSSLVQEELVAAAAPKQASPAVGPPAGVPDLGMPGFGAGELFAAGGANGSAAAAPRPDPFGGPPPAWSVPVVPRASGGFKWMVPVISVLGVAIVGLLGFLVWQQMNPRPRGTLVAPPLAPGGVVQPPVQPQSASGAPSPTTSSAAPPSESRQPAARRHEARSEARAERAERAERTDKTERAQRPEPKPGKGGDPLEGLGGGGSVKEALTKQDVMDGVRRHAGSLRPCISEARTRNELIPKQYTFVLDWVIQRDGSVARPVLKGPAEVMGTSLPSCFASTMRRWSFPPSKKELPISNFPFPVTIH